MKFLRAAGLGLVLTIVQTLLIGVLKVRTEIWLEIALLLGLINVIIPK